jgi:hypothetical protein
MDIVTLKNSSCVYVALKKTVPMSWWGVCCEQYCNVFLSMRFANSFVPRLVYKSAFWDVLLFDMISTEWLQ